LLGIQEKTWNASRWITYHNIIEILSSKPNKVSRGKVFDSSIKLLDEIQKKYNFIKLGIKNSSDFVNENCFNLKSNVQLATEEVILQINWTNRRIWARVNWD